MATDASFNTSSSPTAPCAIIAVTLNHLFTSSDFLLLSFSSSFQILFLYPFFLVLHPLFLCFPLHCYSMASSSSRKKRECTPSPFEGKSSSRSAQDEVQEVVECLAFPLVHPQPVLPLGVPRQGPFFPSYLSVFWPVWVCQFRLGSRSKGKFGPLD